MHRVGAWRLLDMFKELGVPCAMLLNSELYNHCPELMAESRKDGHEVVGHSRTNSEWQVRCSASTIGQCSHMKESSRAATSD